MVEADHVLAADVLTAAEPVTGDGPAGVHERRVQLQRVTADMDHDRNAELGDLGPEPVQVVVAGRPAAGGAVRDPDRPEAALDDVVDLGHRGVDVVEGGGADADQPRLAVAEIRHRPVVCPCCTGGDVGSEAAVEDDPGAEGGEDELTLEPELVEGLAALARREGAERLVPLGTGQQPVAEPDLLVDDGRLVASRLAVRGEARGELAAGVEVDGRDAVTHPRVSVGGQEVGQLHDVAVGIEHPSSVGVGHGRTISARSGGNRGEPGGRIVGHVQVVIQIGPNIGAELTGPPIAPGDGGGPTLAFPGVTCPGGRQSGRSHGERAPVRTESLKYRLGSVDCAHMVASHRLRRGPGLGFGLAIVVTWTLLVVQSTTRWHPELFGTGPMSGRHFALCAVTILGAASCLWRAVTRVDDRLAWSLIAAGMTGYASGFVIICYTHAGTGPLGLHISDWASLPLYPLAFAGLVVLAPTASHWTVPVARTVTAIRRWRPVWTGWWRRLRSGRSSWLSSVGATPTSFMATGSRSSMSLRIRSAASRSSPEPLRSWPYGAGGWRDAGCCNSPVSRRWPSAT